MSDVIIIGIIILIATACITASICYYRVKSVWQVIRYNGNSVEPKDIYICRRCNNKSDLNYHYCDNCGAKMINGIEYIYYSDEIKLDE